MTVDGMTAAPSSDAARRLGRTFAGRCLIASAALAVFLAGPALAAEQSDGIGMQRSHSEHRVGNRTLAAPPTANPWVEPRRRGQGIVYRFEAPIAALAPHIAPDSRLSRLCREGLFGQAFPERLRAVDGHGRRFGLAFGLGGARSNLNDPNGLADRDNIYLFRNEDTGRCMVWSGSIQSARLLAGLAPDGGIDPGR